MANDNRTITLAGNFSNNVDITNSLTNGESCSATNYSHAEGYKSSASGEYSFAGGYRSQSSYNRSFVWSGNATSNEHGSAGTGTFNIWTNDQSKPLEDVYINGNTLSDAISGKFSDVYGNENLKESNNIWTSSNKFTGQFTVEGNSEFKSQNVTFSNTSGAVLFNCTAKAKTPEYNPSESSDSTGLASIATTVYVKNAINSSLNSVLTNYVKRENPSNPVGSSLRPIYVNSEGNVVEVVDNAVFIDSSLNGKSGSSTGLIYVSDGYVKESVANVGTNTSPICISSGKFVQSSANVGNDGRSIIYMSGGYIMESTETVGEEKTEGSSNYIKPIYLKNGKLTEFSETQNVGGELIPVYVKGGKIVPCIREIPSGGGGGGISSIKFIDDGDKSAAQLFVKSISSSGGTNPDAGSYKIDVKYSQPDIKYILDGQHQIYISNNDTGNVLSSISLGSDKFTILQHKINAVNSLSQVSGKEWSSGKVLSSIGIDGTNLKCEWSSLNSVSNLKKETLNFSISSNSKSATATARHNGIAIVTDDTTWSSAHIITVGFGDLSLKAIGKKDRTATASWWISSGQQVSISASEALGTIKGMVAYI